MSGGTKVDRFLVDALDDTGLPYTLEVGRKHVKVRLSGYLVLVASHCRSRDVGRMRKNCLATIRRAAEAIRRGERP